MVVIAVVFFFFFFGFFFLIKFNYWAEVLGFKVSLVKGHRARVCTVCVSRLSGDETCTRVSSLLAVQWFSVGGYYCCLRLIAY